MNMLAALISALGLSTAVGLNLTIPLLIVGLLAHERAIHLAPPFDVLGSSGGLFVLVLLAALELVIDKVVRRGTLRIVMLPFAIGSSVLLSIAALKGTGELTSGLGLALPVVFGGLVAGAVHITRATLRSAFPALGMAILLSWFEDAAAALLSLCAALIPALFPVVLLVVLVLSARLLGNVINASRRILVRLCDLDQDDPISYLAALVSKAAEGRRRS